MGLFDWWRNWNSSGWMPDQDHLDTYDRLLAKFVAYMDAGMSKADALEMAAITAKVPEDVVAEFRAIMVQAQENSKQKNE